MIPVTSDPFAAGRWISSWKVLSRTSAFPASSFPCKGRRESPASLADVAPRESINDWTVVSNDPISLHFVLFTLYTEIMTWISPRSVDDDPTSIDASSHVGVTLSLTGGDRYTAIHCPVDSRREISRYVSGLDDDVTFLSLECVWTRESARRRRFSVRPSGDADDVEADEEDSRRLLPGDDGGVCGCLSISMCA